MRKNLTEIVFILDRSGSMSGLEADTIGPTCSFPILRIQHKSCKILLKYDKSAHRIGCIVQIARNASDFSSHAKQQPPKGLLRRD